MSEPKVHLVGAGPGDPELLTLKAARLIGAADVVVHDRLGAPAALALARPDARLIDVGKEPRRHPVPQEAINAILIEEARAGRRVVRLKGGDPFVFGRGGEEALALAAAGIDCAIVPGVTAAQGIAASARVPLTHRGIAESVRFVTGHRKADQPLDYDFAALADPGTTLVVYMGAASIAETAERLMAAGRSGSTPVLVVVDGTSPREIRRISTLASVVGDAAAIGRHGPTLFVIGEVVNLGTAMVPAVAEIEREARHVEHAATL